MEQSPSAVLGRVCSVTGWLAKTLELWSSLRGVLGVTCTQDIVPAPELGVPLGFHGEQESALKTRPSEPALHPFEARRTHGQGFHGPPAA